VADGLFGLVIEDDKKNNYWLTGTQFPVSLLPCFVRRFANRDGIGNNREDDDLEVDWPIRFGWLGQFARRC
jgi:hypothetical protein